MRALPPFLFVLGLLAIKNNELMGAAICIALFVPAFTYGLDD